MVVKCICVSQRKYKLATKKPRPLAKKRVTLLQSACVQSACTHTQFAHAVIILQFALTSGGISQPQVENHFKNIWL